MIETIENYNFANACDYSAVATGLLGYILPHVTCLEDGIRNVDMYRNFESPEEVAQYIVDSEVVGVGRNAICFVHPEAEHMIFRLDVKNVLGKEWNFLLLDYLIAKYPGTFNNDLRLLINRVENSSYSSQTMQKIKREVKTRIAAHNSQYRRDPLSTMPINSHYCFKGRYLGIRIKYLDGITLSEFDSEAKVSVQELAVLHDANPANVMVNAKNSLASRQLIDIEDFRASSA